VELDARRVGLHVHLLSAVHSGQVGLPSAQVPSRPPANFKNLASKRRLNCEILTGRKFLLAEAAAFRKKDCHAFDRKGLL
jgi:hypothetical protein